MDGIENRIKIWRGKNPHTPYTSGMNILTIQFIDELISAYEAQAAVIEAVEAWDDIIYKCPFPAHQKTQSEIDLHDALAEFKRLMGELK